MTVHERIIRDGIGVADNYTRANKSPLLGVETFAFRRHEVAQMILDSRDKETMVRIICENNPGFRKILIDAVLLLWGDDKENNRQVLNLVDLISRI